MKAASWFARRYGVSIFLNLALIFAIPSSAVADIDIPPPPNCSSVRRDFFALNRSAPIQKPFALAAREDHSFTKIGARF
jgi:hypothetical protein